MNQHDVLDMTQHWTDEQVLAVYDFCRLISETLWQQHRERLLEQMIACDQANGHEPFAHLGHDNLQLPFDDLLPPQE